MIAQKPQYIFLFILDAVRSDHVGLYGYKRDTTPNIDKLSRQSDIYKWAISPASYTLPSVPSIISGKYPHKLSNLFTGTKFIDKDFEYLKKINKDYKTAMLTANIVSSHHYTNLYKFFDYFWDDLTEKEENRKKTLYQKAGNVVNQTIQFIQDNNKERLFIVIHLMEAHAPYVPKIKSIFINDRIYKSDKRKITRICNYVMDDTQSLEKDNLTAKYALLDLKLGPDGELEDYEPLVAKYIAQYDMGIRILDKNVGIFAEFLKKQEIFDKSQIIITSDHGELLGENNMYFFHGIYTHPALSHVPLIIKNSFQKRGRNILDNYSLTNIVRSIAGVKENKHVYCLHPKSIAVASGKYLSFLHNGIYTNIVDRTKDENILPIKNNDLYKQLNHFSNSKFSPSIYWFKRGEGKFTKTRSNDAEVLFSALFDIKKEFFKTISKEIDNIGKKDKLAIGINKYKTEIDTLEKENKNLRQILNSITSARMFRIWQTYCTLRKKLKKSLIRFIGTITSFQERKLSVQKKLPDQSFSIRPDYKINQSPQYFKDNIANLVYQPEVYKLADFLGERLGVKYVIDIGAGNGEKLKCCSNKYKIIAIDFKENISLLKKSLPKHKIISHNLERGLPKIDKKIWEQSIVICADVIEHMINPTKLLRDLSKISSICPYLLISTPDRNKKAGIGDLGPPTNPAHVREWAIEELDTLLNDFYFSPFLIGYTINTDKHLWKNTSLAISGRFANYKTNPVKPLSIAAIMTLYNDSDIIERVIGYLTKQNINVVVIDNWSTDGSFEIVKKIANRNERVSYKRFPKKGPTKEYEWGRLLAEVDKTAKLTNYDWILHHDSDEMRQSPWPNTNLRRSIEIVDALGFNAIDYTEIIFRIVEGATDFKRGENPLEYFNFFEFGKRPGHFKRINTWKRQKMRVGLAKHGGHQVVFPNRKIFPLKFLIKHYPLRTPKQARKKVFRERIPRYPTHEKQRGWHSHYDKIKKDETFVWSKEGLLQFNPHVFHRDYLVEKISGIGIKRD